MMALSCSRVLKQLFASSASRSVGVVALRHPPAVTTHRRGFTSTAKDFISDAWERYSPMTIGRQLLNSVPHTFWLEASLNEDRLIDYKGLKFSIDIPGNGKTTYTDDGKLLVSVYFGLEDFAKNQKIIEDDSEDDSLSDSHWDASLGDKRTDLIIKGFTKEYNIRGHYSAKVNLPTPTLEGNYNNICWKPSEICINDGGVMVYLRMVKEET